ncbi:uncharacterized protein MONOS_10380 [Monocercomonoides exilis]|uniref:uncharacterized protein n=1 Tax=Monocercomonoides exilis TaxID=2049356 RepID=UPI0035598A47|nr:hypothetical protein MONOS_10380 [Monocercomonoides exilis]|eukprot:MONOS_10380.1-p1 / transcript=MONOS_10380.1 / gene=MONOS_10380 / organism=Monocercomonoides_exilis_PA203 / gene_product=unspecified product / transcript_product=unspecified product / location=Mono_scaffold00469:38964-39741(+) / protein_length=164 / sequence_SO=supercontig / SO=protein_coding / is_pseudo=false
MTDISDPNVDVMSVDPLELLRLRSVEKKAIGDDRLSSAHAIDPSDVSAVDASYTSAGAMDDIERRLGHMRGKRCLMFEVCGGEAGRGSDEVMGRGVAVCEVGEIVEKGMEEVWLRMEDMVLSPAVIALAVLEEREEEEEEEGEREDKDGGKEGEEVDVGKKKK